MTGCNWLPMRLAIAATRVQIWRKSISQCPFKSEPIHQRIGCCACRNLHSLSGLYRNLDSHIKNLNEFVEYSTTYIRGAKKQPDKPYPVRPRLRYVKRIFGGYADARNIDIEIKVEPDLMAPLVPVSLYNGIVLNLITNALKAVTAKSGTGRDIIALRAWNEGRWHYLEVSDTGVGIPSALRERVFDPLFTTTDSRRDPLGSGMGLGLTLVRRSAEAFGGHAEIVKPPPGFATCVRVRL